MVKKPLQQKPIRILQQVATVDAERTKLTRKPTNHPQSDTELDNLPVTPVNETQPDKIKKPRGRRPKNRTAESLSPRKVQTELAEVEAHDKESSMVDSDKGRGHMDIWGRFNQLDKTIQEIKDMTLDNVDQLKQQLSSHLSLHGGVKTSDNLLFWVRKTISEEVSKELNVQFDKLKEFFTDFKVKRIAKEKSKTDVHKSSRDSKSFEEEAAEVVQQPVIRKRGRKKKGTPAGSPTVRKKKNNISSVAEVAEIRFTSPRIVNQFTFSNLQEPIEPFKSVHIAEPDTPTLPQELSVDDKSQRNEPQVQEVIKDEDSDQKMVEDNQDDGSYNSDSDDNRMEVESPNEETVEKVLQQFEESESKDTEVNEDRMDKPGPDFEAEFDLNAFSLNN